MAGGSEEAGGGDLAFIKSAGQGALGQLDADFESLPSPSRRGQGLCVTAGHRCEAPGAVQSQEHSSCKAQDQGVVPEQRPGQCFGVIAEQLASEEPRLVS